VGVKDCVFDAEPKVAQPALLYKSVFAIWLMSYEKDTATLEELRERKAVQKVRDILAVCRVEKVVRMCLTVLKNFMDYKPFCADMVDCNVLECVQAVEYEKWRDAELYDEIKELAGVISGQVQEMSNFDRYESELKSKSLKWGYTHTSKFWGENVMKFESNDFRALKMLAQLILSPVSDSTTLAVACYDIGEFVALHPLGKRKVAQLQVKERIMELMGSAGDDMREVRREALLCCQKIMLNKWQDLEKAHK
jgi:V-type H+-transporting ATPase subunit H